MILEEKYAELVNQYCAIRGIPLRNGLIPESYAGEIKKYIHSRMEKETAITRRLQESMRSQIKHQIGSIMTDFEKKKVDSPIELLMWDALERYELISGACKQFEIGPYRIDIAYPMARLAVECDGAQYHRENQIQLERDQKRDKYLARKGWRTLRLEGIAICRDIEFCVEKVKRCLGVFVTNAIKVEEE